MTIEKTRKKNRERQARHKQRMLDAGLSQINAWLDEQTIKRLNKLAVDSSRTEILKEAIDKLYEEKRETVTVDKGSKTYDDKSGFGSW